MFTGIIESLGRVVSVDRHKSGIMQVEFSSSIASELKIDQSVSHNGVCLTVVDCDHDTYKTDIIEETLSRSNLGDLAPGQAVNIERATRIRDRLDGHLVQGHVDTVGTFTGSEGEYYKFEYPVENAHLVVMKGSICINGVSLTVAADDPGSFSVALIPYTLEHTNLGQLKPGDKVNLEFDILGKYVQKNLAHLHSK